LARRTRKTSLEFPSENTVQIAAAAQNERGNARSRPRFAVSLGVVGATSTMLLNSSSAATPGTTAIHRTSRSERPEASSATATSGPTTAPAVSSAR
jgi:hypothetical protein